MTIKEHIKYTLNLAYPIIIGQLGFIMMGVVDSLMVGQIGAAPLAAAALGNSFPFKPSNFLFTISSGKYNSFYRAYDYYYSLCRFNNLF